MRPNIVLFPDKYSTILPIHFFLRVRLDCLPRCDPGNNADCWLSTCIEGQWRGRKRQHNRLELSNWDIVPIHKHIWLASNLFISIWHWLFRTRCIAWICKYVATHQPREAHKIRQDVSSDQRKCIAAIHFLVDSDTTRVSGHQDYCKGWRTGIDKSGWWEQSYVEDQFGLHPKGLSFLRIHFKIDSPHLYLCVWLNRRESSLDELQFFPKLRKVVVQCVSNLSFVHTIAENSVLLHGENQPISLLHTLINLSMNNICCRFQTISFHFFPSTTQPVEQQP